MSNNALAATYRYVHLSDFHLCNQPWRTNILSRDLHKSLDTFDKRQAPQNEWNSIIRPASFIPEIVAGAARFCYGLNRKFDGIIISGDLATTGRGVDLDVAKDFIKTPPLYGPYIRYNEPTICGTALPKNIHLVPGNHDRYSDDFATPGSQTFGLMFEIPHMRNRNGDVGHWVKIKSGRKLGFVYADFALRRVDDVKDISRGPYGQGFAHADILNKLKAKTQELRDQDIPVVWIIHFAPYDCDPDLHLVNFKQVTDAAVALDVLCTLCGHIHEQQHVVVDGHPVFCAGSAGCVDSKNNARLHLMTIKIDDTGPTVSRRNFRWSWDQDAFVEVGSD
ncbi:metallophosphoesterase [Bradyrhizobium manausense]|uniref:metallophosphoesterase family protein n=1 Tax=Bradyrhizobium TaxID=374 RepID=UPI001BA4B978|nr:MULTISPECIES: metallophosphoesterase [Bradyrhizobium]MBR0828735.1 metallophosphoesterase [Bradyrhizobium manausense]UVO32561.1 metallophosphoesterase [Bradyrhizobium arachidis]